MIGRTTARGSSYPRAVVRPLILAALAEQQARQEVRQEALESRQTDLETSQDKTRNAWRTAHRSPRRMHAQTGDQSETGKHQHQSTARIELSARHTRVGAETQRRQMPLARRAAYWGTLKAT